MEPSATSDRKFMLAVECGNQVAYVDMESPDDETADFLLYARENSLLKMRIEEWIYDLKRDEAAMLRRLRASNLHATAVDGFLKAGAGANFDDFRKGGQKLEAIIDRTRELRNKRVVI